MRAEAGSGQRKGRTETLGVVHAKRPLRAWAQHPPSLTPGILPSPILLTYSPIIGRLFVTYCFWIPLLYRMIDTIILDA